MPVRPLKYSRGSLEHLRHQRALPPNVAARLFPWTCHGVAFLPRCSVSPESAAQQSEVKLGDWCAVVCGRLSYSVSQRHVALAGEHFLTGCPTLPGPFVDPEGQILCEGQWRRGGLAPGCCGPSPRPRQSGLVQSTG